MQIELPEFPPIALSLREAPATIGAFYSALSSALGTINPSIDPNAHFVNTGEAVQIKSIADAQSAIARIMVEREGTRGSPDQPPVDNSQLAHYYTLKEIHEGKTLVQVLTASGPSVANQSDYRRFSISVSPPLTPTRRSPSTRRSRSF